MKMPHTITLFNRVKRATGSDAEYSVTVIKGVLHRVTQAQGVTATGVVNASTVVVIIPTDADTNGATYIAQHEFTRLTAEDIKARKLYTYAPGDLYAKGDFSELAGTKLSATSIKAASPAHSITSAEFLDFGSPSLHHWEVKGV